MVIVIVVVVVAAASAAASAAAVVVVVVVSGYVIPGLWLLLSNHSTISGPISESN